jgi:hypothetical protein
MTATNSSSPPRRRPRRLLGSVDPVWLLTVAVAAGSIVLYFAVADRLGPLRAPHMPWWGLALGFVVGERAVVHLHFR